MLTSIKNFFYNTWAKFENWVDSILPGLKTKIVLAAGSLGTLAASVYAYMAQVDLSQIVTAKTLAITTLVVNTLAFWFKDLSTRVANRI